MSKKIILILYGWIHHINGEEVCIMDSDPNSIFSLDNALAPIYMYMHWKKSKSLHFKHAWGLSWYLKKNIFPSAAWFDFTCHIQARIQAGALTARAPPPPKKKKKERKKRRERERERRSLRYSHFAHNA